jgi:FixJ family two-component response regulator
MRLTKEEKRIKAEVEAAYNIHGNCVQVRILDLPKIFKAGETAGKAGQNIEAAVKATKLGAFDFLEKPLSIEKVSVVAKNALNHRRLELENSRLKEDTGSRWRIIGEPCCC